MDNQQSFHYTYSAQQQEEIQAIRQKYLPPQEDKMTRLRKLHHSATRKAQAWSIALGVVGALILGAGMSLIMTDLGNMLGVYSPASLVIGVITGIAGIVLTALAYPVYSRILRKERERIAPQVLQLTDELLQ